MKTKRMLFIDEWEKPVNSRLIKEYNIDRLFNKSIMQPDCNFPMLRLMLGDEIKPYELLMVTRICYIKKKLELHFDHLEDEMEYFIKLLLISLETNKKINLNDYDLYFDNFYYSFEEDFKQDEFKDDVICRIMYDALYSTLEIMMDLEEHDLDIYKDFATYDTEDFKKLTSYINRTWNKCLFEEIVCNIKLLWDFDNRYPIKMDEDSALDYQHYYTNKLVSEYIKAYPEEKDKEQLIQLLVYRNLYCVNRILENDQVKTFNRDYKVDLDKPFVYSNGSVDLKFTKKDLEDLYKLCNDEEFLKANNSKVFVERALYLLDVDYEQI